LATAAGLGTTTINAALGTVNGSTTLTVTVGFVLSSSLNTARHSHTATLLNNGMVLIAGGYNSTSPALATAELYEPDTLTPSNPSGPLGVIFLTPLTPTLSPGTTQQFVATGLFPDGSAQRLASVTGSSSDTPLAEINNDASNHGLSLAIAQGTVTITATAGSVSGFSTLTVRPTGFVSTGSLSTGREQPTATLLSGGIVLIAGGYNSGYLASAELYNPTTGTFASTGSMSAAREFPTATLLNNGMVLVTGGGASSGYLASAELYNPATGTFTGNRQPKRRTRGSLGNAAE
jgi:hypothetical protein